MMATVINHSEISDLDLNKTCDPRDPAKLRVSRIFAVEAGFKPLEVGKPRNMVQ